MPTAHLICGNTGAGKTTYALQLKQETQALHFALDDWMSLFWPDQPKKDVYPWALERCIRSEDHILRLVSQAKDLNLDVILDFGFFTFERREKVRQKLIEIGLPYQIHYLDIDAKTRWKRIQARNQKQGATYFLSVSKDDFDFCETLFEPPNLDELKGAVLIRS